MMQFLKQFNRIQKLTGNLFGILLLISIVLLTATAILGWQVYEMRKPTMSAEAQVRELVEEVSRAIVLPQDELPSVAKVADATQLRNQPFFANAQTGDDILIYPVAQKAILWRSSIKKVVEVSSLITPPQSATASE